MELSKLISKFWGELFPEDLIFLSTYRLERNRKYPAAPIIRFNYKKDDWKMHKAWMLKQSTKKMRDEHNARVLANFRASQKPKKPDGA